MCLEVRFQRGLQFMLKCRSELSVKTLVRVIDLHSADKWGIAQIYLNSRRKDAIGRITGFFVGNRSALRVTHNTGEVATYIPEEPESLEGK